MLRSAIGACLIASLTSACRTTDESSDAKADFTPTGIPLDWGHLQAGAASEVPEALIANAAARRLTTAAGLGPRLSGLPDGAQITDAIVSIPAKLHKGDRVPFGDGQTNRSLSWTGWNYATKDVPVAAYAAFVKGSGLDDVFYVIEVNFQTASLIFPSLGDKLYVQISTESDAAQWVSMARDEATQVYRMLLPGPSLSGLGAGPDFPATVLPAPSWMTNGFDAFAWQRIKIQLSAHADGTSASDPFPLMFRFPSQTGEAAQASMPEGQRTFGTTGRGIGEPTFTPQEGLLPVKALDGWFEGLHGTFDRSQIVSNDRAVYVPDQQGGVHHQYSDPDDHAHDHQAAVGKVVTYVVQDRPGGTEVLYTCFDARNPEQEGQWGVPSGAGWHSIGAPTNAETIVNNMENTGIFAGWGVQTPYPFDGNAPFDAKDVTTFRILRAGQAFTTQRDHLHWYAVDAQNQVCVTIWKHGCMPKSDRDLSCN